MRIMGGWWAGAPPAVRTAPPITSGWESWGAGRSVDNFGSLALRTSRLGVPCNRQRVRMWDVVSLAEIGSDILMRVLQGRSLPCCHHSIPRPPTQHRLSLVASWCAHIISPQPVCILCSFLVELLPASSPSSSWHVLDLVRSPAREYLDIPAITLRRMNIPGSMWPC